MRLLIELDRVEIVRAIEVYVQEVLGYTVGGAVVLHRFEGELLRATVEVKNSEELIGYKITGGYSRGED